MTLERRTFLQSALLSVPALAVLPVQGAGPRSAVADDPVLRFATDEVLEAYASIQAGVRAGESLRRVAAASRLLHQHGRSIGLDRRIDAIAGRLPDRPLDMAQARQVLAARGLRLQPGLDMPAAASFKERTRSDVLGRHPGWNALVTQAHLLDQMAARADRAGILRAAAQEDAVWLCISNSPDGCDGTSIEEPMDPCTGWWMLTIIIEGTALGFALAGGELMALAVLFQLDAILLHLAAFFVAGCMI